MKLQLSYNEIENEFFEDKFFIGINFPHHFSELISEIFQYLSLQFSMTQELKVNEPDKISLPEMKNNLLFADETLKKKNLSFYVFECSDESKQVNHILYQNINEHKLLIPNLKNIDFLWMIEGANNPRIMAENISKKLNAIPKLGYSQPLDFNTFNKKIRLVY